MILGPRAEPYLPSRCESPLSVCVALSPLPVNSESMSHERQSACTSKLDEEGMLRGMEARSLLMVMSSLGGPENCNSTELLVLSRTILPVTLSRDTETFFVREVRLPGALAISRLTVVFSK